MPPKRRVKVPSDAPPEDVDMRLRDQNPRLTVPMNEYKERYTELEQAAREDGVNMVGWVRMTLFKALDERKRRMNENATRSKMSDLPISRYDRNHAEGHL